MLVFLRPHPHILINHNLIFKCLLMFLLLFVYIDMSFPSLQPKNGYIKVDIKSKAL